MMDSNLSEQKIIVAALYKFVQLTDYVGMRKRLLDYCIAEDIKGTILLAEEGINGTVAGLRCNIENLLDYLGTDLGLSDLEIKLSTNKEIPFYRMKVKLKKEIVTMGIPDTKPQELNGIRLNARQWNDLLNDPDVLVIDTRNQYEYEIGTFLNAISPKTKTFRDFPAYVDKSLDPEKHKKIAMFCTGGIRCEKATNYLLRKGFNEVYHLEGGILKYLEEIPLEESLWQGECFVFDNRVTVNENLRKGDYEQCFACRRPISKDDMLSDKYKKGISCPYCYAETSSDKLAGLKERQKQVELAEQRNEQHIGIPLDIKKRIAR